MPGSDNWSQKVGPRSANCNECQTKEAFWDLPKDTDSIRSNANDVGSDTEPCHWHKEAGEVSARLQLHVWDSHPQENTTWREKHLLQGLQRLQRWLLLSKERRWEIWFWRHLPAIDAHRGNKGLKDFQTLHSKTPKDTIREMIKPYETLCARYCFQIFRKVLLKREISCNS